MDCTPKTDEDYARLEFEKERFQRLFFLADGDRPLDFGHAKYRERQNEGKNEECVASGSRADDPKPSRQASSRQADTAQDDSSSEGSTTDIEVEDKSLIIPVCLALYIRVS
jgi:hypothetical protein